MRFLVESYAPADTSVPEFEARARLAAEDVSRDGERVRYLHSIHVPDDELCLYVFEAPSLEPVRAAGERAGLSPLRIVEAVERGEG